MSFNDMVRAIYKPVAHRKRQSMPTSEEKREMRRWRRRRLTSKLKVITDNRVVCTRAEIE